MVVAQPASAATKCRTGNSYKVCATIGTAKPSRFIIGYEHAIYNPQNYTITASCEATTSQTVKYGVSTSVKAEANLIFSSFEASVSYNIEKSMSTGYKTTVNFKIPPKTRKICQRGVLKRYRKGKLVTSWYSAGAGTKTQYFTAGAPSIKEWRIVNG